MTPVTPTATGWEATAGATAVEPEPETPEPTVPEPEPEPEPEAPRAVVDKRQRWTCVTTEGPRHHVKADGPPCPVFGSDAHLFSPPERVICPTCGSISVRKAFDGEV